jgi:pimeloyl-ACP methyl ester carboxylesterase
MEKPMGHYVIPVSGPPDSLTTLIERFDRSVFDGPKDGARVRLRVEGEGDWDALVGHPSKKPRLVEANGVRPDARLSADSRSWNKIATDVRGGMDAFRSGKLHVRDNLHLGVGLLAATSASTQPGRLRFETIKTEAGKISTVQAGEGDPLICIPGLGGTKASFLPTLSALAEHHRVIALDLPGFGDSDKPVAVPYDAPYFARSVYALMDALEIDEAHLAGNSMGGRVALEAGLMDPSRTRRVVLLSPALAWLKDRRWEALLRLVRPELGLIQLAPRPIVEAIVRRVVPGAQDGWSAAGVDEFLRAFHTARGRAAFYAAARNIYLDRPDGDDGFWPRLRELEPDSLFFWGVHDTMVPAGFRRHVEEAVPHAEHIVQNCGHVPQLELPVETHRAMRRFLAATPKR